MKGGGKLCESKKAETNLTFNMRQKQRGVIYLFIFDVQ